MRKQTVIKQAFFVTKQKLPWKLLIFQALFPTSLTKMIAVIWMSSIDLQKIVASMLGLSRKTFSIKNSNSLDKYR